MLRSELANFNPKIVQKDVEFDFLKSGILHNSQKVAKYLGYFIKMGHSLPLLYLCVRLFRYRFKKVDSK